MSLRDTLSRLLLPCLLLPWLGGAGLIHTEFDGWRRVTVPGTGPLPEEIPDLSQMPGFKLNPRLMEITLGEVLDGLDVRLGDVVEANIVSFTVEASGDLDFVSAAEVWLFHGVTRERLAARYAFVDGSSNIVFHVDDVNLSKYLTEPDTVIAVLVNGLPPVDETTITARFTIRFGLSAQGACYALQVADDLKDAAAADTDGGGDTDVPAG